MPSSDVLDPDSKPVLTRPSVEVTLHRFKDGSRGVKIDGQDIALANFDTYGPNGVVIMDLVAEGLARFFDTDLTTVVEKDRKSEGLHS